MLADQEAPVAVSLRCIGKSFGKSRILDAIDLDIREGEFCVFVGPSGCGKSTLLRIIAGLEQMSEGDLSIAGQRVNDVAPAKRGVAMVFQSYALYPHMTVYDNMAFGLKLARRNKKEVDSRVRRAADMLELGDLLNRLPKQLSGGQRQRVAIGRAIVREPRIFLLDEPLSNLDAALRVQMRIELSRLHGQLGCTTIYVTHDQVEAMTLADRIVIMNQGRIVQAGAPLELYEHPQNRFAASFLGSPSMNFLAGRIGLVNADGVSVDLEGGLRARVAARRGDHSVGDRSVGDRVILGVRPEHVELSRRQDNGLATRVHLVERLGDHTVLHMEAVTATGSSLAVKVAGSSHLQPGQEVFCTFPPGRCHLFDEAGEALPSLGGRQGAP